MKNLFEKLFKRDDGHDYVIAEYEPNNKRVSAKYLDAEYEIDLLNDKDEMEIDNIYSRS
jgi:hypothetical protein